MRIIDTHCDTLYRRALRPQETPCVTAEALRAGGVNILDCWMADPEIRDNLGFALRGHRGLSFRAAGPACP